MYYAVIDLGSNTIRLVIYKVKANKYTSIFNEKNAVGILNYVEDGILSEEGIQTLIEKLDNMHKIIELMHCTRSWCFATASIRNIKNMQEVIDKVLEATSVQIMPISGEEEAYYDFVSLKSAISCPDFIGCDLGGGSLQVVQSKKKSLVESVSLPIGSLRMYRDYVGGALPTSAEAAKISEYTCSLLKEHPFISSHKHSTLYMMGGTARAIVKLYRALSGSEQPIHGFNFTLQEIDKIQESIQALGIDAIKVISKVLPDRTLTILPGLIVISSLAEFMGVKEIIVAKKSVRDGFLIEHILDGEYNGKRKI